MLNKIVDRILALAAGSDKFAWRLNVSRHRIAFGTYIIAAFRTGLAGQTNGMMIWPDQECQSKHHFFYARLLRVLTT